MIISTNWLSEYVSLPVSTEALVERLLLSGLNHESTSTVGADTAIEIEVTSNRPDCLGHIGVAREAAVLFARPLHIPDPRLQEAAVAAAADITVEILEPQICPFYSARAGDVTSPNSRVGFCLLLSRDPAEYGLGAVGVPSLAWPTGG